MNKTKIKNFAVEARNMLIKDIELKAQSIGITSSEIKQPLDISKSDEQFFDIGTSEYARVSGSDIYKRNVLVGKINDKAKTSDYKSAYTQVVEEVAYTWFNRLIAIRFMEVNEFLPSRTRVLSSEESGKTEPDIVTKPFETDIEFSSNEQDTIHKLKDENKLDDLFRMLFIKQCNKLNEILPNLFEKTNNYSEILLTISFTDPDNIINHLVNDIDEDDWKDAVQIIGWLYQYYNTEPKADVFAGLKKNIKISKENIPAATQLFTPDWIVRYMVENSLGRIFIVDSGKCLVDSMTEQERTSKEKEVANSFGWKYYLPEAEQTEEVRNQLHIQHSKLHTDFNIEDIKIIDPCMGSGHILVYAFDVLMQIYESQGYTSRDAVASILENNLFGLDIDERAYQLAYFALMMKARSHDRRFFSRKDENGKLIILNPQIYCPKGYADGEEYGSLLNVDELEEKPKDIAENEQLNLFDGNYEQQLNTWNFRRLLNQKYDVVVTNPPYMGGKGMSKELAKYVQEHYADSKSDMFAVFIERTLEMAKQNGYSAMITQHAFMFLSSYEKLRAKLLHKDIINMAHLGARAFEEIGGEVVQTTSFVLKKSNIKGYKGSYKRLVDFNSQDTKEQAFLTDSNLHTATQENFSKIPGSPIAYWVSEKMLSAFENGTLKDFANCCTGMQTGNNDIYVRCWYEVKNIDTSIYIKNGKYQKYNCGGESRRWYGNHNNVVLWEENGKKIKSEKSSVIRNESFYFKQGISWKRIGSSEFALRYLPKDFIFDQSGDSMFMIDDNNLNYILGFVNSNVALNAFAFIAPTLNLTAGNMNKLPIIIDETKKTQVENLVKQNISLSKTDWDSFETSWDFERHPLI